MTKASKGAIALAAKIVNDREGRDEWGRHHYSPEAGHCAWRVFSYLADYIQKVSDIAERCADPTTTDKGRYEALQELIVKDADPVEEMFGKDGALIGFSTETIRSRIEAFGYKLVKDE